MLTHQQATNKYRTLIPNTEEHAKLSAALQKTGIVEISLPQGSYKINTHNERLLGGFGSGEHFDIGAAVKLKGLSKADEPLLVNGDCSVGFSHIVALAGDFYGIAGQAISLPGGTDQDKTERFEQAFRTLVEANPYQLQKIVATINLEHLAIKESSLPHHCYSNQMMEKNQEIKKIKKDFDELLIDNSDHFYKDAKEAYRIGHALAIKKAQEASQKKDVEGLKRAYAIDGFACHFLTDLFAAGHIRNQRGELELFLNQKLLFSSDWAKKLAGILTGAQHEQDGKEGLNVCNQNNEYWRAYGDGFFFSPQNRENKEKVIAATQKSVDEIHQAFVDPNNFKTIMDQLIPKATSFNPPPVYSLEETTSGLKLFLHRGTAIQEITSKRDYLEKGLSQALRYLPEKFIQGFIDNSMSFLPGGQIDNIFRDKVIFPQISRLTGTIWHMVGIATYHQLHTANSQLNEKIDELASLTKGTYENTSKILDQLKKMDIQLAQLLWEYIFNEIREPIAQIKDVAYSYATYKDSLNPTLQQIEDKLWHAHVRIGRVLSEGTTMGGEKILTAYQKLLQKKTDKKSFEIKVDITLWFKEILIYQIQGFCFYSMTHAKRVGPQSQDKLREQILSFEASILKQLEVNQDIDIDKELIFASPSYTALQLEKNRIKENANQDFQKLVEQYGNKY